MISDERLNQLAKWVPGGRNYDLSAEREEWKDMARELLALRASHKEGEEQLKKIVSWTCQDCGKERPLFIQPDTGRYTHCLGGNYCSADGIHRILNTKVSQ